MQPLLVKIYMTYRWCCLLFTYGYFLYKNLESIDFIGIIYEIGFIRDCQVLCEGNKWV